MIGDLPEFLYLGLMECSTATAALLLLLTVACVDRSVVGYSADETGEETSTDSTSSSEETGSDSTSSETSSSEETDSDSTGSEGTDSTSESSSDESVPEGESACCYCSTDGLVCQLADSPGECGAMTWVEGCWFIEGTLSCPLEC